MPAVSKQQQQLFALVKAYKDGKNNNVDQKVKDIANDISDADADDFASTSTKGLPTKVKKEESVDEVAERDYKAEYKKFQSSPQKKKYRAELNKYNRDKGTYGNGDGKDASHKGGKIVGFESESKNRGRAEKSRLKKENTVNEGFIIVRHAGKEYADYYGKSRFGEKNKATKYKSNALAKKQLDKMINAYPGYKTLLKIQTESINEAKSQWDYTFPKEKIEYEVTFLDRPVKVASVPSQHGTKLYYAIGNTGKKPNRPPKMYGKPVDALRAQKKVMYTYKNEGLRLAIRTEIQNLMAEASKPELGYAHFGNGVTVYDKSREEHGDYKKVAHISDKSIDKREVKFYDKKLPSKFKAIINKVAEKYWKSKTNEVNEASDGAGWKVLLQIFHDLDKKFKKADIGKIKTWKAIWAHLKKQGLGEMLAGEIGESYSNARKGQGTFESEAKALHARLLKISKKKKKNEIDLQPRAHMRPHFMS